MPCQHHRRTNRCSGWLRYVVSFIISGKCLTQSAIYEELYTLNIDNISEFIFQLHHPSVDVRRRMRLGYLTKAVPLSNWNVIGHTCLAIQDLIR